MKWVEQSVRTCAGVNISQNLWIFHPGKVCHNYWFWEEFQFCQEDNVSQEDSYSQKPFLGRDFSAQDTFKARDLSAHETSPS
jgi:hypothetical protein